MNTNVTIPSDEIDDDAFQEEGIEYNMRELMDQVYEHKDLIITVPSDQVNILKQGLITRKAKDNTKLKDSDVLTLKDVLSFLVYPSKKDGIELQGLSDVRVKLGPRKSVQVLDIRVPNNEF